MSSSPAESPAAGRWTWLDLRLIPVAATVWLVELAAAWVPASGLLVLALGAAGLALLACRTTGSAAVLLSVLAAVAVAAGSGAIRHAAQDTSPLARAAAAGRSAELVVELAGEPRPVRSKGGGRVAVDATARQLRFGATAADVHDRVLIFGPAAGWAGVATGSSVRVRGRLSAPQAGDDVVATLSVPGAPVVLARAGWLQRAAGGLRDGLVRSSARVLDDGPAGLLPGLVVGDTRAMDPVVQEDFKRSGLTHLTAVSGANVAIVLSGVLWPLRRRSVDRRVQAGVAAAALAGFVTLAGPQPSVLRAAVMGAVGLLALATGRPRAAVPALGAAVTLLLLVDPGLATDAGFALSVAATAAIVLLAPRWSRALRRHRVPTLVAEALSVSAAAGIATAPLIAAISAQVSLVSLPANLLAAPAVAPATVLGLLAALTVPLLPALGDALVWLAGWPVRWLVAVAVRAAGVPDGVVGLPAGTWAALLLALVTAGVGVAMWRFARLRVLGLVVVVALVAVAWPLRHLVGTWPPPRTLVVACDVGQGDALVVPTGPGQGMLVDTGPDVGPVDDCLRRLGVHTLPLVLLSHLDADHAGGLAGALAGRSVGVVATGPLSPADTRVARIDQLARRSHAARRTVLPGVELHLGPATVQILAPPAEIAVPTAKPNDLSVLTRVTVRGVRILFTGDLGAEAESRILDRGVDVRADVLKVPHHGSADADPQFLAATGARVALISVGAHNDYGHPTPRTLSWLAHDGMWTHRTDLEGDLAVTGSAGAWGVAWRRGSAGEPPMPAPQRPAALALPRKRRRRVTRCRRDGSASGTDLAAESRGGRGGAAAVAGRGRRPSRRARPPPRRPAA